MKIDLALKYIQNVENFEDELLLGANRSYRQLGEVKKTLKGCQVALKGAIAALSQNKTFPADVEAAKAFLRNAL